MRLPKQPLQCPTMATAGNVLTLAALLLPPLYMPNGYVGLVGAKFHLLLWLAGIGCALLLCCLQKSLRRNEHPAKQAQIAGLPLLLLCLSYTVAWFFAENPAVALWGLQGRYNGLIMLLACTVLYFAVQLTGGGIPTAWFGRLLAGAGCAVTLLCGMNFFMVDPLDAYYSFLPESGELFLGTVGNINFYGAFLDLCLPIAVWELLVTPDGDSARLWGAASVCLGAGLVVAGSDAAWLGAVSAVTVLCMARRITAGGFPGWPMLRPSGHFAQEQWVCWLACCLPAQSGVPCRNLLHSRWWRLYWLRCALPLAVCCADGLR